MNRRHMYAWVGLCALVAVVSGGRALAYLTSAGQLGQGQSGLGSPAFWEAFLRFQRWGFIACFAVLVGLVSQGIVRQPRSPFRVWLLLWAGVAVWYGVRAIDRIAVTVAFNGSPDVTGSLAWWDTYLAFHQAAWRSLGTFGLGLIMMGIAAVRRDPPSLAPREAGRSQPEYR